MIDRLEERQAIAKRMDDRHAAWDRVNSIPEVEAARAAAREARERHDEASAKFNAIFDKYAPREDAMIEALTEEHPDIITLGEDDMKWIPRCAVTRLPLFAGDLVYVGGGREDYEKSYILASAVKPAGGVTLSPVVINAQGDIVPFEEDA